MSYIKYSLLGLATIANMLVVAALVTDSCNKSAKTETAKVDTANKTPRIAPGEIVYAKKRFDPKIRKYLEIEVELLENNSAPYNWGDYRRCPVGLLIQIVTGLSGDSLGNAVQHDYAEYIKAKQNTNDSLMIMSWGKMINYYNGVSNRRMKGVLGALQEAGFNLYDITALEFGTNLQMCQAGGIDRGNGFDYTERLHMAKYLRGWIRLIDEQEGN